MCGVDTEGVDTLPPPLDKCWSEESGFVIFSVPLVSLRSDFALPWLLKGSFRLNWGLAYPVPRVKARRSARPLCSSSCLLLLLLSVFLHVSAPCCRFKSTPHTPTTPPTHPPRETRNTRPGVASVVSTCCMVGCSHQISSCLVSFCLETEGHEV